MIDCALRFAFLSPHEVNFVLPLVKEVLLTQIETALETYPYTASG